MHQKTEDITASSETKVAKAVLNPGSEECLEAMTEAVVGALNCDFPRHMHGTHAAEAESTRLGAQAFEISHRH